MAQPRAQKRGPRPRGPAWDAGQVRALRRHLSLSQEGLAEELGARQQTVSEWETGRYRPRGTSARLLTIIAERAGFEYETGDRRQETGREGPGDAQSM
ncbi:MAG: helix-turn-helix domain-containing protein [Chloroflexi bacterium]|nr:helix-turn-helix domain-containing protein [Chloroflexota bacterium]